MRSLKNKKRLTSIFLIGLLTIAVVVGSFLINHFLLSHTITEPTVTTTGLPVDNSEDKTTEQKSKHTVPPKQPRNIQIDSIGVNANMIPLGLLADNTLDAPTTAWDVGWYKDSNTPSDNTGALLLDGHVNNTLGTPGVFYDLYKLKPGAKINLETGDHKKYTYTVEKVEQIPTDEVDMTSMMRSIDPNKQGLNIITCGGEYDHKKSTFDDRVLVYATRD